MPQVISANRLGDGIIVFLAKGGNWVESLAGAEIFADKTGAEAGLAAAGAAMAANIIIEITPFDVDITSAGPVPRHIRDRIRSAGPTVRLDHGKQAV